MGDLDDLDEINLAAGNTGSPKQIRHRRRRLVASRDSSTKRPKWKKQLSRHKQRLAHTKGQDGR